MKKVFLFLVVVFVLVGSCKDTNDPFDVLAAQRHMTGTWECTEEEGEKSYQITLSADGMMNVAIENLFDIKVSKSVVVNLLSEDKVLIPTQENEIYNVEGTGTISEYKKMVLELNFNDGSGTKKITVTCNKIITQ